MIYSTFIAPSEAPPSILQIKRAILTYDKVLISEPRDRDIIPPHAYFDAISRLFTKLPFPISGDSGPVRPLGKVPKYDNKFDQIIEECSEARKQGILKIVSTYPHHEGFWLGPAKLGDYPLNPTALLQLYRSLASNNDFLLEAIRNDHELLSQTDDFIESLSVSDCNADKRINASPATPLIQGEMIRPELRQALTDIARSRLAATLKIIGYCATKEIVPFFSSNFYNQIARKIALQANEFIDRVAIQDPYWTNRSLTLRLAHEEHMDDVILDNLSVSDVLKLRSSAWGDQASARDNLMRSLAEISREIRISDNYEERCRQYIRQYRSKAEDLERERADLKLKIKCDLGIGIGGAMASITAGSIAQIQTSMNVSVILLAGCVYAFQRIKEYGPVIEQLRKSDKEFKQSAGFGLHQYFQPLSSVLRR